MSWENSRTPTLVLFALYTSVTVELLLVLWAVSALPLTQRPWRSDLRELPDAGLLLLVLRKLHITPERGVTVLDLSSDATISRALSTLANHGAIHLVSSTCPPDAELLVVVDMDAHDAPPPLLTARLADGGAASVHYVAWSPAMGFGKVAASAWSTVALGESMSQSIVAKPSRSSIMLETVLCRILSSVLSDPAKPECVLTAGGRFEVDYDELHAGGAESSVGEASMVRAVNKTGKALLLRSTGSAASCRSAACLDETSVSSAQAEGRGRGASGVGGVASVAGSHGQDGVELEPRLADDAAERRMPAQSDVEA